MVLILGGLIAMLAEEAKVGMSWKKSVDSRYELWFSHHFHNGDGTFYVKRGRNNREDKSLRAWLTCVRVAFVHKIYGFDISF